VKIFFQTQGCENGLPVIFIHGFPLSHEMWQPQVLALASTYLTITYDVAGHGKSDVGPGLYTIDSHVDDLFGLMDKLKLKKAVLVGLSMGGYIALRAWERNVSRIKALVLCDTRSTNDNDEGKIKRAAALKDVLANGSKPYADTAVKSLFCAQSHRKKNPWIDAIKKIMAQTPVTGLGGNLNALAARTDYTPRLHEMKVPTLILVGSKDEITPPKCARLMHLKIPHSEMHVIPHAGHMSNLENLRVFNKFLLEFLEKLT
jgi:pimeloyl-ACP methyl ester carboxylesterase